MDKKQGLDLLREPFSENQISKLPKGTKAQNQCPEAEKINCPICKGKHHPKVIHLDYVGHAALTDRLLDADPLWTWEPFALKEGLPAFDATGGLWIRLTVCGHTRIGYGHAEASNFKEIGSREKEVIGDALRNAAMRFGAALDLWHKGDLHIDDAEEKPKEPKAKLKPPETPQEKEIPSMVPGSSLHKKIEAQINEAGFERELFKEWLGGIGWIQKKDGKLSLSTLSEKNAKTLCEKWDSAQITFNSYVDAKNQ